jgi:hypothetical protein
MEIRPNQRHVSFWVHDIHSFWMPRPANAVTVQIRDRNRAKRKRVSVDGEKTLRQYGRRHKPRLNIVVDCVGRSNLKVLCASTRPMQSDISPHSVSHDDTSWLA